MKKKSIVSLINASSLKLQGVIIFLCKDSSAPWNACHIHKKLDRAEITICRRKSLSVVYMSYRREYASILLFHFSSVQSLSRVWLFATPWTAARQASLSITNSQSVLKLMSIESVMLSNHLILCCPLLLLPQPLPASGSFPMSQLFTWGGQSTGNFSFSIRPSNEHPGLISFKMDWLDLLAVQGSLKSLLQHHSSKAIILWHSAFFTAQLSHPYMTTGKTIALTRWTK